MDKMFRPIVIREQLTKTAWHLALVAGGAVVSVVLLGGNSQDSNSGDDPRTEASQPIVENVSTVSIGPRRQDIQPEELQRVGPSVKDYIGPGFLALLSVSVATTAVGIVHTRLERMPGSGDFSPDSIAIASVADGFTYSFSTTEQAVLDRLDESL